MCTKAEVREVMLETKAPAWMRYVISLLGLGAVSLLTWISLSVHAQDGNLKDLKTEMISSMSEMRMSSTIETGLLTNRVIVLSTELKNFREATVLASNKTVTIDAVKSRNSLVDERYRSFSRRLSAIEDAIKNNNNN